MIMIVGSSPFPSCGITSKNLKMSFWSSLFYRNIGYVSRHGAISSLKDCAGKGMRFINRQTGSGVRNLVDHLRGRAGPEALKGYETDEVYTHFDVVRSVATSTADFGIAANRWRRARGLTFSFIFEERFDMLVRRSDFFDRHVQAFVEFVRSERFSDLLKTLKGYSARDTGRIMYRNPWEGRMKNEGEHWKDTVYWTRCGSHHLHGSHECLGRR
ncbi:MAG: substrate-binding domain-containing protein [Desulfobacterales bacterium]|nr:substrate-binding domain-containing protein [Desulfobacterales bacterium]